MNLAQLSPFKLTTVATLCGVFNWGLTVLVATTVAINWLRMLLSSPFSLYRHVRINSCEMMMSCILCHSSWRTLNILSADSAQKVATDCVTVGSLSRGAGPRWPLGSWSNWNVSTSVRRVRIMCAWPHGSVCPVSTNRLTDNSGEFGRTDYERRDQVGLPRNMKQSGLCSWFNVKSQFPGTQQRWLYFPVFCVCGMGGDALYLHWPWAILQP